MSAARAAPTVYEIPAHALWVKCGTCGKEMAFVKTAKGRSMPVTREGISHFIDCPGASSHRRGRRK